jgi:hypothetical protein
MPLNQVKSRLKKNAGYTMLFAVLVSTVLLSIGIFILNVSKKEVLLSAIGRESAIAFYAADGGVECAHYWNVQANSPLGFDSVGVQGTASISCGGTAPVVTPISSTLSPSLLRSEIRMDINVPPGNSLSIYPGFCAKVSVIKDYIYTAAGPVTVTNPSGTPESYSVIKTTIESRGYNTCVTGDPRRVERGLKETIQ